jgi:restriction system protein
VVWPLEVEKRRTVGTQHTNATFTRDARDYADRIADGIILIDGLALTALMIEHGVGVTQHRVVKLPRIDRDYFEAE